MPLIKNNNEKINTDDIRIRDSSIQIQGNTMNYLLYEFERKTDSGRFETIYKAIRLIKIKRVPKKDLTLGTFLQMQEGVVAGYYENEINFIQIIANIIKPDRLGLIFAYGVQGVSQNSMDEAMHEADLQMAALERCITGTFRTLEYENLNARDGQWIYQKMSSMDAMRIIRGIPEPKRSQGRIQTSTFFQAQKEDAQEQTEEFLMGMDEFEYLFVLMASPVSQAVISKWKEQNLKEQSYYASLRNGQKSMTAGVSMPMVYAANAGTSQGWGTSKGTSFGENWGENQSHSVGESVTHTQGTSHTVGHGTSHSISNSYSQSTGVGQNVGTAYGESLGHSSSASSGVSSSVGASQSISHGQGSSESVSVGTSHSTSSSSSFSSGGSHSTGSNYSIGTSDSVTEGVNQSTSQSAGTNVGVNGTVSIDVFGVGGSAGMSVGQSSNIGSTNGTSMSESTGLNTTQGFSETSSSSWSSGFSSGVSDGTSQGYSTGTSVSDSVSAGLSNSYGASYSQGVGDSYGQSMSASQGASMSSSVSTSRGETYGTSTSESFGTSESVAHGNSVTDSVGTSKGLSAGVSEGTSTNRGTSTGMSSSMGIGPSISFSRSYAWEDREIMHIVDLLQFSGNRIVSASNGYGMWFTDIYIACEDEIAAQSATALAMSAWHGKNVLASPLQVYTPDEKEKEYLMKHLSVFSPSTVREGMAGQFESYKYSTLLLADEIAAYSHPPRANIGGILAAVDDPPILSIPGGRQNGEIFLGYVADTEKYSKKRGYQSTFRYTLRSDELHHAYISGASRSGKTVAARRLVAESYLNVRRGEKQKKLRFLIMDPKQDWRALSKVIPNEKFRFYSLSDPTFHPIRMNLLKIPNGVFTERYADKLREIFIRSYGLGDRGFQILGKAIREVYRNAGCFDEDVKYNKKDPVTGLCPATQRSRSVTMEDVCARLQDTLQQSKQRDQQEAIQRVLDRMESFSEPESSIYAVFCNRGDEGMGIDDLLGADDVVVLESYGMDTKTSAFIFGLITSSVYQYAVSNGGFVRPDDQYETVLVIEEANQVLIGEDQDNLGGANPFEVILDQSAGYGLFIWTLTQKIADMPRSVLANSAIKMIGRQDDEMDIQKSIVQIGKDGLIADRVFKNWLPDQPTGWFIIKSSRNRDFTKNAPAHVLIEYLNIEPPSDEELDSIIQMGEIERQKNA